MLDSASLPATHAVIRQVKATVTFKVVNGTWADATTAAKTVVVPLIGGKGALAAADVPTGMIPSAGYAEPGAWDTTPNTSTDGITGNVTYTYTFSVTPPVDPEDPDTPGDPDDPFDPDDLDNFGYASDDATDADGNIKANSNNSTMTSPKTGGEHGVNLAPAFGLLIAAFGTVLVASFFAGKRKETDR